MDRGQFLRFTALVALVACVGLAAQAVAIWSIDPLHLFRPPGVAARFATSDRYRHPGIARWQPYSAALIGSSITADAQVRDFDQAFGVPTANLAISGTMAEEQAAVADYVLAERQPPILFWEVNPTAFSGPSRDISHFFPVQLYRSGVWQQLAYLLDREWLLAPVSDGFVVADPGILGDWSGSARFGRDRVLAHACTNYPRWRRQWQPLHGGFAAKLNDTLGAAARAHPHTLFYAFVPPLPSVHWAGVGPQRLGPGLDRLGEGFATLLRLPNLRLFVFLDAPAAGDWDHFKDDLHLDPATHAWMAREMAAGRGEITAANLGQRMAELRQRLPALAAQAGAVIAHECPSASSAVLQRPE